MKKILHVVNSFDPAGDVVRSVKLLKQFSKFEHEIVVKERHPFQHYLQFEESRLNGWMTPPHIVQSLFDWCDATIYHFLGAEAGWHEDKKPAAYRNSNSYFDTKTGKFFYMNGYSATDFSRYKLLASSHLGAGDFIPNCRFLPALIPIFEPEYLPDYSERSPCFSFSKHGDLLLPLPELGETRLLYLNMVPHRILLNQRRKHATIVLDNISDGHYGLAGTEALALGLPAIAFNHQTTRRQIYDLAPWSPFIEIEPTRDEIIRYVQWMTKVSSDPELFLEERQTLRSWIEKYYNPQRLIERYWEPFCEELLG